MAKISGDGSALLFSTYLGGTANESEFDGGYRDLGIAVDSAGSAYVAGTTRSVDFPITPLAFQQSSKGGLDAFVPKIASGGSLTTLASSLNSSTYGQKVTFTATVVPADNITPTGKVSFTWSRFTIGSATLDSNGVATLTKSNLNSDVYPLTAIYGGDAHYPPKHVGCTEPGGVAGYKYGHADFVAESVHAGSGGEVYGDDHFADRGSDRASHVHCGEDCAGDSTTQRRQSNADNIVIDRGLNHSHGDLQRRLQYRQKLSFGHADRTLADSGAVD